MASKILRQMQQTSNRTPLSIYRFLWLHFDLGDRQKLPLDRQDPTFLSENFLKAAKRKENKNEPKDQQNSDIFLKRGRDLYRQTIPKDFEGIFRHNKEAVLIERKPFSSGWEKLSKQERIVRIQLLATNLDFSYMPEDLHILGCKGLVVSKGDCQFVSTLRHDMLQLAAINSNPWEEQTSPGRLRMRGRIVSSITTSILI